MSKSKKLSSLEDLGGFVYSTNENFKPEEESEAVNLSPSDQQLEAHFEKKGRGGKTVVIIKGFEGPEEDLKDLSKTVYSNILRKEYKKSVSSISNYLNNNDPFRAQATFRRRALK